MTEEKKYTIEDALEQTLGLSKGEFKKKELEEAHRLCQLPRTKECMKAVLRNCGFARKTGECVDHGFNGFCRYLDEHYSPDTVAIARLYGSDWGQGMVPIINRGNGFAAADGTVFERRKLTEAWVFNPDKAVLSCSAALRKTKERRIPDDTDTFKFVNRNPRGKYTGDCAIRAVAEACGMTWHQALDKLGKLRGDVVNSSGKVMCVLHFEGFKLQPQAVVDGRPMTGAELCEKFNREFHSGEIVVTELGKHGFTHVAAVMPDSEDGVTRYRIHDAFDSTGLYTGCYYVKGGQENEKH